MRRTIVVAVGAALLAAGMPAMAQDPAGGQRGQGGPGGRMGGGFQFRGDMMSMMSGWIINRLTSDAKLAQDIGLTADQTEKLKAKVEEMKAPREELAAKLQAADEAQRKLMDAETPDEAALMKSAEDVGNIRIDMSKLDIKSYLAVRSILTADQIQKIKDSMRQRMEERGGRRGGPQGGPQGEMRHEGGPGSAAPAPVTPPNPPPTM